MGYNNCFLFFSSLDGRSTRLGSGRSDDVSVKRVVKLWTVKRGLGFDVRCGLDESEDEDMGRGYGCQTWI